MKNRFNFLILFMIFSISLICDEVETLKTIEVFPKITILEFGDSVQVEFVDFNNPQNRRIINSYFIKKNPAQIFLDEENNVIYRHTGFLRKKLLSK